MKIFKYLLFLLLILIIGVSIYVAVQPNNYSFSRSKVINAPQAVVFDIVNNYKEWPKFSPWIEKEPEADISYDSITTGKGAGYSWNGEILGIGSMTTLDVNPYSNIDQKIEFIEPFESESNINWTFKAVEGGTEVRWSMQGEQDFMTKIFTTFMGSIEENTGPDFERGLYKLDSLAVEEVNKYSVTVNGITEHSGGFYLYTSYSTKMDKLSEAIDEHLSEIGGYAISNNISLAGAPFINYHEWDPENNAVRFSACVPTTSKIISTKDDIITGQLLPFKAMKVTLKGSYDHLQEAWTSAQEAVKNNPQIQEVPEGPQLEIYIKDPSSSPNPSKWITEIYIAIEEI